MSDEKGYNGWSNYETWNAAVWLDNDQGSYNTAREMAQEAYDQAEAERSFTREERATLDLAKQLEKMIKEQDPLAGQASMFSDLLTAALGEIDWYEISEHYMEDVGKEPEEEDEEEDEELADDGAGEDDQPSA